MKRRVFCSFCQLPQKIYKSKHIGVIELMALAIAGAVFSFLVWQDFHWAGVLLFAVLAIVSDLVYQLRWRLSVRCQGCGFDPVLYKKNPEAAAERVKIHLEERKKDPLYLLKPQPKITPIIKKVKDYKWTEPRP